MTDEEWGTPVEGEDFLVTFKRDQARWGEVWDAYLAKHYPGHGQAERKP